MASFCAEMGRAVNFTRPAWSSYSYDTFNDVSSLKVSDFAIELRVTLLFLAMAPLMLSCSPFFVFAPFVYVVYEVNRTTNAIHQLVINKLQNSEHVIPHDVACYIQKNPQILEEIVKHPALYVKKSVGQDASLLLNLVKQKPGKESTGPYLNGLRLLLTSDISQQDRKEIFLAAVDNYLDFALELLRKDFVKGNLFTLEEQRNLWIKEGDTFLFLLKKQGFDINAQHEGKSAFILALENRDLAVICRLLKYGAAIPLDNQQLFVTIFEAPLSWNSSLERDRSWISFGQLKEQDSRIAGVMEEAQLGITMPQLPIEVKSSFFDLLTPAVSVLDNGRFFQANDIYISMRTMLVAFSSFSLLPVVALAGASSWTLGAVFVLSLSVSFIYNKYQWHLATRRLNDLAAEIFRHSFPSEALSRYILTHPEVIGGLQPRYLFESLNEKGRTLWEELMYRCQYHDNSALYFDGFRQLADTLFCSNLTVEEKHQHFLQVMLCKEPEFVEYLLESKKVSLSNFNSVQAHAIWLAVRNEKTFQLLIQHGLQKDCLSSCNEMVMHGVVRTDLAFFSRSFSAQKYVELLLQHRFSVPDQWQRKPDWLQPLLDKYKPIT